MKKGPILILLPALISLGYGITAFADALQTGTVAIGPGNEIAFFGEGWPDDFDFPTTFVPKGTGTTYVWKTLDPAIPGNLLEIGDNDPTRGFSVTAAVTDFVGTSPENRMHFDNLSMVTLTQTPGEKADGSNWNDPPGAPNVTAPAYCNWQPQQLVGTLSSACGSYMDAFEETPDAQLAGNINNADTVIDLISATSFSTSFPATGGFIVINDDVISYSSVIDLGADAGQLLGVNGIDTPHNSLDPVFKAAVLLSDLNPSDSVINVSDESIFASSGWVSIEGDVIAYSGTSSGQLTGVTGIDAVHLAGNVVTPHQTESQQIEILNNSSLLNPHPEDVGTYSIGFGFRLAVDANTIPDSYSTTITYTLISFP
jgi:hypothetical protein